MYGLFLIGFVPYEAEITAQRLAMDCGSAWPSEYWAWRHVYKGYHANKAGLNFLLDVREVEGPMEGHAPQGENGVDYFCGHCREMEKYLAGDRDGWMVTCAICKDLEQESST